MTMKTSILFFALILLTAGAASPQNAAAPTEFTIGAADLIEISVFGISDFSREMRVNNAGMIRLPFLGEIKLEGLTPTQAEARLADLLSPDYVRNPQVSVIIKEPRSRMFTILGAVMNPGQYQMLEPVTLVTAIASAGGLDLSKAGEEAIVQRSSGVPNPQIGPATAVDPSKGSPATATNQISIDLKKLLEGDLAHDIPIRPGDVISITEREEQSFFVIGDVNRPGPFEFPQDQGIKLSRAIGIAGGPTRTSNTKDTALIRQHKDGTVERIAVNLDKVLKGEDPDLELLPNDMLYVPGSVKKSLGWGLLGYAPTALTRIVVPY
jgi:polysaccharide export outer membrane protein